MQKPPHATPRESTEAMVRNIGRELAEIEQAIDHCRGDRVAEPRLTGTWMAHLLISSNELLINLLIDTARPRHTEPMTAATLADWTTPQPFALPDLGPGIDGEVRQALATALQAIAADPTVQALVLFGSRASGTARPDSDLDLLVVERTPHLEGQAKVASWWRHFGPLKPLHLPVDLIVSGSADAARLAGSRWHVISEAARHGRVLVV